MKKYPALFIWLTGIILLSVSACNKSSSEAKLIQPTKKVITDMTNNPYEEAWKEIEEAEKQGLPKTALEKTEALYKKANSENNYPQIVKTVLYRSKYKKQLSEEGSVLVINELEEEIAVAQIPTAQILQSVAAEIITAYANQNQWRFANRTETVDFDNKDISTWSLAQLQTKSAELYLASLSEKKLLQSRSIEETEGLTKGGNVKNLRPTLYDLLAHRAIDYFMDEQNHLTKPVYEFELRDPAAFAYTNEFINSDFPTKDETSAKKRALEIFQDLLSFHQQDGNLPALVDAELKRLNFVHFNAVMSNKDALYLSALEKLFGTYENQANAGEILYAIGKWYQDLGYKYQREDPNKNSDNYRYALVKAGDYFSQTRKKYPDTYGAYLATSSLNNLQNKYIGLQTESINLPNKAILTAIEYQNTEEIFVKVITWSEDLGEDLSKILNDKKVTEYSKRQKNAVKWLNTLPASQISSYKLPGTDDLRLHTTEIYFKNLPLGSHLIVVGTDKDFSFENNFVGYTQTYVTDLNLWARTNNNVKGKKSDFVVYNRTTGAPEAGVKVEFYRSEYNSLTRRNVSKKVGEAKSDNQGFFLSPFDATAASRRENQYRVKLTKGQDTYFPEQTWYDGRYRDNTREKRKVSFFTDRAIYRPGQTIYFKGIVLDIDKKDMPSIAPKTKIQIEFKDANWQNIENIELTSNEYGTFNGTFTAPVGGLLGRMSINAPGMGSMTVRVEEYKRPKFEVKFNPIEGSFALDDEVSVEGHAKAFAGNNVDGAEVTYRVVREARFPYLPWWYRSRIASSPSVEITNGKTQTDSEGKFNIKFTALADPSIDPENKPLFTYTVYADVTDITGETRSNQQALRIGYASLLVDADVPNEVSTEELTSVTIKTTNPAGDFAPAQGTFRLSLLQTPEQVFFNRNWAKPEYRIIKEDNFKKEFPQFAYAEEDLKQNWEVTRVPLATNFDTGFEKTIDLRETNLSSGVYLVEIITEDKNGKEVKWSKTLRVFNPEEKAMPFPDVAWHYQADKNYEPGEEVEVLFNSAAAPLHVLFEVEKDKKLITRKWLKVSDLSKEVLQVNESDRGNFHYHWSWAQMNRSQNRTQVVRVPWTNKELMIEYTTFRDKLLPGQEEEWQLKISGPKGEKVAAEMLATMYDASLDAFAAHDYRLDLYSKNGSYLPLRSPYDNAHGMKRLIDGTWQPSLSSKHYSKDYPRFNLQNSIYYSFFSPSTRSIIAYSESPRFGITAKSSRKRSAMTMDSAPAAPEMAMAFDTAEGAVVAQGNNGMISEAVPEEVMEEAPKPTTPAVRENLNETVFFYPDLKTDAEGNLIVKFKMNEALTRWKFMSLAHTKDLKTAISTKEVVTQKDLMVVPNPPRFFRENDEIEFTAKVVNLSEKDLSGTANLELINPLTGDPVFVEADFPQDFKVKAGQSERLAWYFNVPEVANVPVIQHTTSASAGKFTDAERSVTPVLTNRMLVVETMPLPVKGGESKTFTFTSMQEKSKSNTLKHQGLTLEFTSNPAWYAVQALPYLMEYPYECTEQVFSRYYANSLATSVANQHPKIKTIFDEWRTRQPEALLSNLTKNQELKTALLEETPWVLNAQSEEAQKRNIGLLFDLNRMANEQASALRKLRERQLPNGGFPWMPGGRDNWYISQYLVEALGHLDKLGVAEITENAETLNMIKRAVEYCDEEVVRYYEKIEERVARKETTWEEDHLKPIVIHYIYARTFFTEGINIQANKDEASSSSNQQTVQFRGRAKQVFDYFVKQSEEFWLKKNIYSQGMISLTLHRLNKAEITSAMVKSFKERALQNEELGMYFKGSPGYSWYELPIEKHSLMIEVMDEVAGDQAAVEQMKIWLLKNKQTNHWKTTKATASAVYALLGTGDNWLLETAPVKVGFDIPKDNKYNLQIEEAQAKAEAGTGYFKTRFDGKEVTSALENIKVENPNKSIAWGAAYWQYFEQMDKITSFEDTPLTIKKQLFKVVLTDTGEKITPIKEGDALQPGDKIKVRVELRVDRGMEYVHMKDGRASGFEPINVISRYKYQGGLGYYESTRDASTDFFFSYLPKGTHVFEYPIRVVHKGDFSNGITTVQCMYAPEFTSHSEGVRVSVD